MKLSAYATSAIAAALFCATGVVSQATTTPLTEPNTNITFASAYFEDYGLTFGYALPSDAATKDATEYIGYIQAPNTANNGAWSGFSHSGQMIGGLLLQLWPYNNKIQAGFRYATADAAPDIYTGNAGIRVIYSSITPSQYTVVYRCTNCWSWTYEGTAGSSSTSSGFQLFAWAQASFPVLVPSDVNSNVDIQHNYSSTFGGLPAQAANANYAKWATLTLGGSSSTTTSKPSTTLSTSKTTSTSVKTTTTSSVQTTTAVSTTTAASVSGTPAPTTTYDYIVVGAGAGGIPLADKLSESGKSVLLIERGPASTGQWGGTMKPTWLSGTSLTRFDVPGLDNEIWADATGISCNDIGTMAGCILGGGTAINAGLWWNPPDQDFDRLFPSGWKASDMSAAVKRVFSRIPGTYIPSQDGIDYNPNGYNLIGGGLAKAGWANVSANSVPNQKNKVFSRGPFMYSGGQRGGPLATYLATAAARKNFKYILNTDVRRLARSGGHVTGVEVQPYLAGGYSGTIKLTPNTGRVILSAGAFGSARILLRSGIGPSDQLNVVKGSASDGATMINSTSWINLPVGQNLDDHTNTNIVISHPSVNFYDFYKAYDNPNTTDKNLYLNKKSGILAKSAPNIGPLFFDQVTGTDGIVRQFEYTARCEGWLAAPDNNSMVISQYLGLGGTSRGRATIDSKMNMAVTTLPYLNNDADKQAVISSLTSVVNAVKAISGLTFQYPTAGQSVSDYVTNYPGGMAIGQRTANHWVGTAKMGTDDGRKSGGTAVVDTNTKVYGTDNLFVVDASIFPGIGSANPSSMIVAVAEQASQKILALAPAPVAAKFSQCGGAQFTGSSNCAAGSTCIYQNDYYSQCL